MDAGEQGVHPGDSGDRLLSLPLPFLWAKLRWAKLTTSLDALDAHQGAMDTALLPFPGPWFWISDSGTFPAHLCFAHP